MAAWTRCRSRSHGRPPTTADARARSSTGRRFQTRTAIPWRDLPERHDQWETVYGLFRRWQRDGTWHRIFEQRQAQADVMGLITWASQWTPRSPARTNMRPVPANGDRRIEPPGGVFAEPGDHGLGRSRGGLTTKVHLAVERAQEPTSLVITAGQGGDSPQFQVVPGPRRGPPTAPGEPPHRPNNAAPTLRKTP
ncbi:transposase, partial [Streptomyces sp. NPDC059556]|uniref:transposase n=1 Tax=Streptomyces sp. NPDC059556 TaxID=3346863 RepID=UPI0036A5BB5D